MYRYFNATSGVIRIPDETFIILFAEYIGLSEVECSALLAVWEIKRHEHYRSMA